MGRVGAAAVLLPPLVAVVWLGPAWSFLLIVAAVTALASHEFFGLFRNTSYRPYALVGTPGALVLAASFYRPGYTTWFVILLVLATGAVAVRRANTGPTGPGEVALTVLGACYTGLLLGSIIGLRVAPSGRSWVIFFLAILFLGDTGAYYTGRGIGGPPLAPRLSPNKTWAGFCGGVGAAVAAALGFGAFLFPEMPAWHAAALGLVLALLGVVGDLFESLVKRSVGVKDASSILPGHGGMLDRLDSLLFSAPALLLYVQSIGV